MRLSKRHKAEVDMLANKMTTPFSENLLKRPKAEVFPAYLPSGVGTHGNTTSNVAEVSHRIFDAVRDVGSIYRSLRTAVEILHHRSVQLRQEYVHAAALCLGQQDFTIDIGAPAPGDLLIPAVHAEFRKQAERAMALPSPEVNQQVAGEQPSFSVNERGEVLRVTPNALLECNWDNACGCQNNANVKVFCKHVQRCLVREEGQG